jgi:hypothetical protein
MVCLNVRKTYGDLLDDVLGAVPHRLTFHAPPDDSPPSSALPRRGAAETTLRDFMQARVSNWQGYEPVVLLCRNSGNAFVRRWLRQEEDRELVNALILIDALHGAPPPGKGFEDEFSGVVEFARDCLADPGAKLLLAVSTFIQAGSAHSVGFGALLRHAVWATAAPDEIIDTRWADNIEIVDLPELDNADLPVPTVSLLRSRLVPFAAELGPASAPDLP